MQGQAYEANASRLRGLLPWMDNDHTFNLNKTQIQV